MNTVRTLPAEARHVEPATRIPLPPQVREWNQAAEEEAEALAVANGDRLRTSEEARAAIAAATASALAPAGSVLTEVIAEAKPVPAPPSLPRLLITSVAAAWELHCADPDNYTEADYLAVACLLKGEMPFALLEAAPAPPPAVLTYIIRADAGPKAAISEAEPIESAHSDLPPGVVPLYRVGSRVAFARADIRLSDVTIPHGLPLTVLGRYQNGDEYCEAAVNGAPRRFRCKYDETFWICQKPARVKPRRDREHSLRTWRTTPTGTPRTPMERLKRAYSAFTRCKQVRAIGRIRVPLFPITDAAVYDYWKAERRCEAAVRRLLRIAAGARPFRPIPESMPAYRRYLFLMNAAGFKM
jgi:hypothetical protein